VFAVVAALIFLFGFIFRVANVSSPSWILPTSMILLGLFFLALHLAGFGTWIVGRVRQAPPA
jgi:hypothetical protein